MDARRPHPADIEHVACPLCGSERKSVAYRFAPFAVTRCDECGFHYLSPRLCEPAMRALYESDDYYAGATAGYDNYDEQALSLRLTFRRFLENLHAHGLTGGSLLEIGCGYGYFLEEARPYFHHRCGTEYSGKAAAVAKRKADALYQGGIDAVPAGEAFDCIVGIQMIEHVYRPVAFLQTAVKALSDGGLLVLVTPDLGSFWRSLFGKRWPSFKIPEHVAFFDGRTLTLLMEKAGLSGITKLPYPHAFPLPLVFRKLGIRLPHQFHRKSVWISRTSVALYGRLVK